MALVGAGWDVVVTYIDRGANTTTRTYPLTAGIDTDAEIAAAVTDILTAAAGVTDCVVSGYNVVHRFEEDALTIPTLATAEVSAQAEITGRLDGFATKTGKVVIPGPKPALFTATSGEGYNIVDPTNAAMLLYAGLFGVTANIATVSDGEQFSADPDFHGIRTHKRSRNG